MKKMISLLLVIAMNVTAFANYFEGQVLSVAAPSGLKLRVAPEHGSVIKVIPYGEAIVVMDQDASCISNGKDSFVVGKWIMVTHKGDRGYIFDGYLTELPLPFGPYEKAINTNDILSAVEGWIDFRMTPIGTPDTLMTDTGHQIINQVLDYCDLEKVITGDYAKLDLHFDGIRIMDIYHIIQNMIDGKKQLKKLVEQTIYITNNSDELQQIKIHCNNPISISKIKGKIRLRIINSDIF